MTFDLDGCLRALAGPRHDDADLTRALAFCEGHLAGWTVSRPSYRWRERTLTNLIAERPGTDGTWVVCAAHVDTLPHSPGANDNATGIVALLALAQRWRTRPLPGPGLRLAFTTNEEAMAVDPEAGGARHLDLANVRAVLAIDTIGHYDHRWGSQACPRWWLRPLFGWRGDYLAVVTPWANRHAAHTLTRALAGGPLPVRCLPAPAPWTHAGDHAYASRAGIPLAVRLTDTDRWRSPHYHRASDLAANLDVHHLALAIDTVDRAVAWVLQGDAADEPH